MAEYPKRLIEDVTLDEILAMTVASIKTPWKCS